MSVDNNEEKNKIVLNRKMRLWNKYKRTFPEFPVGSGYMGEADT